MRILVRADDKRLNLALPTRLVCSNLTGSILKEQIKRDTIKWAISDAQIEALLRELRRVKKLRGKMMLVDVQTAKGETVKIWL